MAEIPPEQQGSRRQLGRWIGNWMTQNSITQKAVNDYGEATGYGPWGSQISALINQDKKTFDPKIQFLVSIASLNSAISKNHFPKDLSLATKEIFLKAEPFLNGQGEAATSTDLFALFTGTAEANSKYMNTKELTDVFIAEFCNVLHETFDEVCKDLMINRKEGWERIKNTSLIQQVEEPEINALALDILRGEKVATSADAITVLRKYRDCPLYVGIQTIADKPFPRLQEMHEKLLTYCDLWAIPSDKAITSTGY